MGNENQQRHDLENLIKEEQKIVREHDAEIEALQSQIVQIQEHLIRLTAAVRHEFKDVKHAVPQKPVTVNGVFQLLPLDDEA